MTTGFSDAEDAAPRLPRWAGRQRAAPLLIDLTTANRLTATDLVAVAVACELATSQSGSIDFIPPEDAGVAQRLSDRGLFQLFESLGVQHGLPRPEQSRTRVARIERVRRFETEQGLELTTAVVMKSLLQHDSRTGMLYDPMFELGMNAVEHSERQGGYLAVDVGSNGGISFAVADNGVGLRHKLGSTGRRSLDDAQAVALAARRHVSSATGAGRGRGISGVIGLTGRHRGQVSLASGTALGVFKRGHWDPRVVSLSRPIRGTVAQVQLDCSGG